MPKVSEALRNAQILGDFSNLKPSQADYFRHQYPDFAPQAWWDHQFVVRNTRVVERDGVVIEEPITDLVERDGKLIEVALQPRKFWQWQETQRYLRNWWRRKQYKDDVMFLLRMINSVFDPDPPLARKIEEALRELHGEDIEHGEFEVHTGGRVITQLSDLREGYIPMQGAMVYLFQNSWRARLCQECGIRIVATHSKNNFCDVTHTEDGLTCKQAERRRQKRKSWHTHKNEWRPRWKKHAARVTKTRRTRDTSKPPA